MSRNECPNAIPYADGQCRWRLVLLLCVFLRRRAYAYVLNDE